MFGDVALQSSTPISPGGTQSRHAVARSSRLPAASACVGPGSDLQSGMDARDPAHLGHDLRIVMWVVASTMAGLAGRVFALKCPIRRDGSAPTASQRGVAALAMPRPQKRNRESTVPLLRGRARWGPTNSWPRVELGRVGLRQFPDVAQDRPEVTHRSTDVPGTRFSLWERIGMPFRDRRRPHPGGGTRHERHPERPLVDVMCSSAGVRTSLSSM